MYTRVRFIPSGKLSQPHDPTGQTLKFEESTVFDNDVKTWNIFPEGGTALEDIYSGDIEDIISTLVPMVEKMDMLVFFAHL